MSARRASEAGEAAGYRIKNKNPTERCGEKHRYSTTFYLDFDIVGHTLPAKKCWLYCALCCFPYFCNYWRPHFATLTVDLTMVRMLALEKWPGLLQVQVWIQNPVILHIKVPSIYIFYIYTYIIHVCISRYIIS